MKTIEKGIYPFQEKDFFSPIRSKIDYARLIVYSARSLLINYEDEEMKCESKMRLVIDKMSRLFLLKEGRFISISFPFNVRLNENEISEINTYSGIEVNSKNISSVISILNDEQFRLKPSPMDFWIETNATNIIGLSLLEEIFQFEPSYIRYDIDPENEKGKLHPLHHLDVNYSSYGTYKIGLNNIIIENYFENLLNINTDCCFIRAD